MRGTDGDRRGEGGEIKSLASLLAIESLTKPRETTNPENAAQPFVFGQTRQPITSDVSDQKEGEEQTAAGAEADGEVRDTTPKALRGGRARNSTTLQDVREEEEELPGTPSARTMEEHDTPRRGVLFSSPSKRPPRLKDRPNTTVLKSKQRPTQYTRSSPLPEKLIETEPSVQEEQVQSPPRKRWHTPDPELEHRKQEKAKLERQVLELEREVAWCSQQVEIYGQEVAPGTIPPTDRDALM